MKKILLFQVDQPIKVKQAVATMRMRVETIPVEKFHYTVNDLLEGKEITTVQQVTECPQGSLLLMCGLSNAEVDQVLYRIRSNKISLTYKAIVTPTNLTWNVYELYQEMEKEKMGLQSQKK